MWRPLALSCMLASALSLAPAPGPAHGRIPPTTLAVAASAHTLSAPSDSAADRQAVEAAWSRMLDVVRRGDDPAAIAALYTEDASYVEIQKPTVRGRTAIEANWARELAAASFSSASRDADDFVSDGHLAVESGFLSFIVTPRGKTTGRHVRIRYVAAWEKQPDGRWLTRTWLESPAPAAPKTQ